MGKRGKKDYLRAILKRYRLADKKEKRSILDEFCKVCEYNRKYAIRLLSRGEIEVEHWTNRPAGRRNPSAVSTTSPDATVLKLSFFNAR